MRSARHSLPRAGHDAVVSRQRRELGEGRRGHGRGALHVRPVGGVLGVHHAGGDAGGAHRSRVVRGVGTARAVSGDVLIRPDRASVGALAGRRRRVGHRRRARGRAQPNRAIRRVVALRYVRAARGPTRNLPVSLLTVAQPPRSRRASTVLSRRETFCVSENETTKRRVSRFARARARRRR